MRLEHVEAFCLVSENELLAATRNCQKDNGPLAMVDLKLWRQFRITGDKKFLFLEFRTVNQRMATYGPWVSDPSDEQYGFTWEDLADGEFLVKMVAHEQFRIGARILDIFQRLLHNNVDIRNRVDEPAAPRAQVTKSIESSNSLGDKKD
jgi:hypothetical protein